MRSRFKLALWDVLTYAIIGFLILTFISFVALTIDSLTYEHKTTYVSDNTIYKQLDYWTLKRQIIDECDKYIDQWSNESKLSGGELFEVCDEHGVDVRLPLIQGRLESQFGTKGLARKTNSVWNQGAYDQTRFDRIHNIYKYPHPNASIEPYVKLLKNRYMVNGKTEFDLMQKFIDVNGNRYATNINYEKKLRKMWADICHDTPLDSLLYEYELLKAELKWK